MKKTIILCIGFCLIGAGTIPSLANHSSRSAEHIFLDTNQTSMISKKQMMNILDTAWSSNCNYDSDWIFGSEAGPQLWHITSRDAWTGNSSLGCFDYQTYNYMNNMFLNYALANITLNMKDVIDMVLDFYCKFITEDNDDHWGIVLYDPNLDVFLPHRWNAIEPWQQLPYDTYGYHPLWMGPMQPIGEYQSFNIKAAYDHWYEQGYFRYPQNGTQSYDLLIGFMMYETDESGYTNAEAEAHGDYWSGLFIDDVKIRQLVVNHPPDAPSKPSGPADGVIHGTYVFSTNAVDSDGDTLRYGWDWNNDNIIDEWTSFYDSGKSIQRSHRWDDPGTYYLKVLAEDEHGDQSEFSPVASISISDNLAPLTPEKPTGPQTGKAGVSYSYQTYSTDPNGDNLYYLFDWGDGNDSGWDGPYASGETVDLSYIWEEKGNYDIRVKAKDDPDGNGDPSDGIESEWSEPLTVAMPKNFGEKWFFLNPALQEILFFLQYPIWRC